MIMFWTSVTWNRLLKLTSVSFSFLMWLRENLKLDVTLTFYFLCSASVSPFSLPVTCHFRKWLLRSDQEHSRQRRPGMDCRVRPPRLRFCSGSYISGLSAQSLTSLFWKMRAVRAPPSRACGETDLWGHVPHAGALSWSRSPSSHPPNVTLSFPLGKITSFSAFWLHTWVADVGV